VPAVGGDRLSAGHLDVEHARSDERFIGAHGCLLREQGMPTQNVRRGVSTDISQAAVMSCGNCAELRIDDDFRDSDLV
jgi:hypothetical protein